MEIHSFLCVICGHSTGNKQGQNHSKEHAATYMCTTVCDNCWEVAGKVARYLYLWAKLDWNGIDLSLAFVYQHKFFVVRCSSGMFSWTLRFSLLATRCGFEARERH